MKKLDTFTIFIFVFILIVSLGIFYYYNQIYPKKLEENIKKQKLIIEKEDLLKEIERAKIEQAKIEK